MLRKVSSAASLTRSSSTKVLDATTAHVHKHLQLLLRTDPSTSPSGARPSCQALSRPVGWTAPFSPPLASTDEHRFGVWVVHAAATASDSDSSTRSHCLRCTPPL
jgi:hypothetical protein